MDLFQCLEIAPKKAKPTKHKVVAEGKQAQEQQESTAAGGQNTNKRRHVQGLSETSNPTPVIQCKTPRCPISTLIRTPNTHLYTFSYLPQTPLPQNPLTNNPYAVLTTPGSSSSTGFTPHPHSHYAPMSFGYPYFYPSPMGTPSDSYQTPIWYPIPYQYPPGLPPPPPPTS